MSNDTKRKPLALDAAPMTIAQNAIGAPSIHQSPSSLAFTSSDHTISVYDFANASPPARSLSRTLHPSRWRDHGGTFSQFLLTICKIGRASCRERVCQYV